MIGDGSRTIGYVHLTRPRSARPFTVDDVQQLDRLRPWLAHALCPEAMGTAHGEDNAPASMAGAPVCTGQMILTPDARIVFQTSSLAFLLRLLAGESAIHTRYLPVHDRLPAPVLKLLRQIAGAANGTSNTPPRMQISTAYGVVTLEAKWLVPAGVVYANIAKDPKSCLIAVTIELHEHAIPHAARVLRERGATPAQTKVGIHLALGKSKPMIADELGLQRSSVADHAKKLYQTFDVHNSTELATKIWVSQRRDEARQDLRRAGLVSLAPSSTTGFVRGQAALSQSCHSRQIPG